MEISMSKTRKIYFLRLVGRVIVFIITVFLALTDKQELGIIHDWNFFERFSVLHILWGIWMWDMILQLIPVKAHISIGSQKIFQSLFRPIKEKINKKNLKSYIVDTTKSAYKVMVIWVFLTITIFTLHRQGIIDSRTVLVISVFSMCAILYVCLYGARSDLLWVTNAAQPAVFSIGITL